MSSTVEWRGQEDVEPLQEAKDKDWQKLKSSRLYVFTLVIQDHIESIGKANNYQEGVRCCLMSFLLEMLSDMLQSPQLLSHIHICPKPKVKLGPTGLIHLAPPSSLDIATLETLVTSVSSIGISVSPRWDCKLFVSLRNVLV